MSQQPCLPVGRLKDAKPNACFEQVDIQALDASEYLAMVVQESRRLPEVFLSSDKSDRACGRASKRSERHEAPIDGSAASLLYLVSERTKLVPPPNADYLPAHPEQWVDRTLSNFSILRQELDRYNNRGIGGKDKNRLPLPAMNDRAGWHIFCVGVDEARGNAGAYFDDDDDDDEEEGDDQAAQGSCKLAVEEDPNLPLWKATLPCMGYAPTTSLLLQMDQVLIRRVLGHLVHYIRDGWSPANAQTAAWLYALLARLERPLHREDAATLFGLLKCLTKVRSNLDATDDKDKISKVNVLITIVGVYFEQGGSFSALMQL